MPVNRTTSPPPAATDDVRASTWRWLRWAAITITLFLGYQLLVIVHGWLTAIFTVVLYVVFGAFLSLILAPLVAVLTERLRLPRTAAALLAVLSLLVLVGGVVSLAAGPLVAELRGLISVAPHWIQSAQRMVEALQPQLASRGISVGNGIDGLVGGIVARLPEVLLSGVTGILSLTLDFVIVLVVTFWILRDGAQMRASFESWLPARLRPEVTFGLDAVQVVVGGYVRAQLLMAILIGTLAGVGCFLLGVPFPFVVAIAAGIFELVPIIGPFAGGAVALALALTVSPILALYTLGLFLGIHVLEGYILAPRIQARFVQLHPLVAFLALFAGIEVGGFIGALLAVPVASLCAVFLRAALGDWRASRPDLFEMARTSATVASRRRRLLGQFGFFGRPRPG